MRVARHQVQNVLRTFGAKVGLPDLTLDEGDNCAVLLNDSVLVDLDFSDGEGRLTLSAFLGRPPEENQATLHRALLGANLLGRGSRGATLSLHEETGGVVLWRDLRAGDLEAEEFERLLDAFGTTAQEWMVRIREASPPAPVTDENSELWLRI